VTSTEGDSLELPAFGLRAKGWDIELNDANKQKFMEIFVQRGSKIEESGILVCIILVLLISSFLFVLFHFENLFVVFLFYLNS
jgi:hypothetical protein